MAVGFAGRPVQSSNNMFPVRLTMHANNTVGLGTRSVGKPIYPAVLLHRKLNHTNYKSLKAMVARGYFGRKFAIPKKMWKDAIASSCAACIAGKGFPATRNKPKIVSSDRPWAITSIDFFGKMQVKDFEGNQYALLFVCNYSTYVVVILCK